MTGTVYFSKPCHEIVTAPTMLILEEDPSLDDIQQLLNDHLDHMRSLSPPESVHALDVQALKSPDITFWTLRDKGELLGCGALKTLDQHSAEIKSMKTSPEHLRKSVASKLLTHLIKVARNRSIKTLYLETGSPDTFSPAQELYRRFGFTDCGPFGDYTEDHFSLFMKLDLNDEGLSNTND